MKKLGILLSGRGSNFESIARAVQDGTIAAEIALVVSNRSEARGIVRAKEMGFKALSIHSKGRQQEEYDREVVKVLKDHGVDLVCMAGFMRILSPYFIQSFPNRILNIHPSLLPAFPGLDGQRQALEWGVKFSGCTVHIADETVDGGPIIRQAVVGVFDDDTEEKLSLRILREEHRIYPEAIRLMVEDGIRIEGRRGIEVKKEGEEAEKG